MRDLIKEMIVHEDVEEITVDCLMFSGCTMKVSFGPVKEGSTWEMIRFNFEEGWAEFWPVIEPNAGPATYETPEHRVDFWLSTEKRDDLNPLSNRAVLDNGDQDEMVNSGDYDSDSDICQECAGVDGLHDADCSQA